MKKLKYCLYSVIAFIYVLSGCKQEQITIKNKPIDKSVSTNSLSSSGLYCTAQTEQTDYNIYKMCNDGTRIGDVMPYFDATSGKFYIYYLKDIWNDATNQRHPWYGATTNNFYSYSELSAGEMLSCSTQPCDQDFSVGTGSIVKNSGTYYGFYSGHNPNYPSSCVTKAEGIMLATSNSLNNKFNKNTSFTTIYPPTGLGFDETNNFRDPYVIYDNASGKYDMLIAARNNVNGTWKGVIAKYTSTNLLNWTYQGILYDGGTNNYFMMETPQIFQMGSYYYLIFSDINSKHVYYRKSNSINGPWSLPTGYDRFEGNSIYAAKSEVDNNGNRYIFGWTNVLTGNTDAGSWQWGGNLVAHKLSQDGNGDLIVSMPPLQKSYLEQLNLTMVKNSQWGAVTNTIPGTESYNLVSNVDNDIANVIYEPVTLARYKISAVVSYTSSNKDFGFMIGACDGFNDFYSLRFVPSQNKFRFDKVNHSLLTNTTIATNDVPLALNPNTNYNIDIVVENSMVVVYINNIIALSSRIYKASGTNWGIFVDHSNATFNYIGVKYP